MSKEHTPYTQEQLDFIYKNRGLPRSVLGKLFNEKFRSNRTSTAIKGLCNRFGWLTGRTGWFQKGHKTWNAGTKGLVKKNKGSFQKGQRPGNWRPVGTERVNVEGYIEVKVAEPNRWRSKHVVVWESKHGKIEKGYVVRFKDNNPLNCNIDNLEKVSRKVHLRLNQCNYVELPAELKPAMKGVVEVEVKIFEEKRRTGSD